MDARRPKASLRLGIIAFGALIAGMGIATLILVAMAAIASVPAA